MKKQSPESIYNLFLKRKKGKNCEYCKHEERDHSFGEACVMVDCGCMKFITKQKKETYEERKIQQGELENKIRTKIK